MGYNGLTADARFTPSGRAPIDGASSTCRMAARTRPAGACQAGTSAPLVYVVDNDAAFRDSMRWLLGSAGYAAAAYGSAEAFLCEYDAAAALCVILDVALPGMSGPDLQQELKRRGDGLPVIFVSAHAGVAIAVDAIKSGAVDFLQKPFAATALLDALDKARALTRKPGV